MKYIDWDLSAIKRMEQAKQDWKDYGTHESKWQNYIFPPAVRENAPYLEKIKQYVQLGDKFSSDSAVRRKNARVGMINKSIADLELNMDKFTPQEKQHNQEVLNRLKEYSIRIEYASEGPERVEEELAQLRVDQHKTPFRGTTRESSNHDWKKFSEQIGGALIDYKIDTLKKYLSGNISEVDSIILQDLKK